MENTPHINLLDEIGFARTVLMPGDPLRAKKIAEDFLDDAVLVNNIRGIQGYTGYYKGHKVSVMASGMGIPSIGIYSYELYTFFGVENIIRIGSAGGLAPEIRLRDIVAGIGANTNSNFAKQFDVNGTIAPTCSYELLSVAVDCAKDLGLELKVGNLYSADTFYDADPEANKKWADLGSLAVEMEAAGLYLNAMRTKKR
ncbi:MAG: purine-nucleoside phosphorylase, partial [Acutalibacteraceae bacterium]